MSKKKLIVDIIRMGAQTASSRDAEFRRRNESLLYGWPLSLYDRARMVASGEWEERFGDDPVNGFLPHPTSFALGDLP